jgi:PIN domain nuclease of toxin-antitoxin system
LHPRLLLDTHILVRWLIETKKLTREQARLLNAAVQRNEPLAISAITLLEIALLVSGHKLKLQLAEFLDAIVSNPIFRILPLTAEVAAEAGFLAALVDPADRTIVATARLHRLTLLTSDERIIESGLVKTAN